MDTFYSVYNALFCQKEASTTNHDCLIFVVCRKKRSPSFVLFVWKLFKYIHCYCGSSVLAFFEYHYCFVIYVELRCMVCITSKFTMFLSSVRLETFFWANWKDALFLKYEDMDLSLFIRTLYVVYLVISAFCSRLSKDKSMSTFYKIPTHFVCISCPPFAMQTKCRQIDIKCEYGHSLKVWRWQY